MANSHVWVWREVNGIKELLIQRRAKHLPRRPGYLHASASGHVNLGESPQVAAIREAQEELSVNLDVNRLKELFVIKGGPRNESFNYAYAYEIEPSVQLEPNPDEVESVTWIELSQFDSMRKEPGAHMLIDLGQEYFDSLMTAISVS
ncbi:MAG: NUDIX domain-containing protein [Patescibacteria group bacterium]